MRKPFRVTDEMRSKIKILAAKAYIQIGLWLIVIHGINKAGFCTCGDLKCNSVGKHPLTEFFPRGVHSATDDIKVIRRALKKYPDANLAMSLEGRTVVDIDGPEGEELVSSLNLKKTIVVKTSRGKHLHFYGELKGGVFKRKKLDILTGKGRYVLLPPSMHVSGVCYRWMKYPDRLTIAVPAALNDLRNKKRGRPASETYKYFAEGKRNDTLFKIACSLRRRLENEQLIVEMIKIANDQGCRPPLSNREIDALIKSSANYGIEPNEIFGPPKITKSQPVEWLWYPYIPRHGVTLLAGNPGVGKSLLTALITGIVTVGKAWPLSDECPTGNKVLLLSAEDNWVRVTLGRLEKAGFDIDNLHIMHRFHALDAEHLDALEDKVKSFQPDLIIIDTISAYMGGARDMHRQNEVGEFLAILTSMLEETGSAALVIGHLNKQSSEPPLMRIMGSVGFAASIRSALFAGRDPENPNCLALAHGKTSAAEEGSTIMFDIVGGGRDDYPELVPVRYSDLTDFDICVLQKKSVGAPSDKREAAKIFILDMLQDGEAMSWSDIEGAAIARSICSPPTMLSARNDLVVEELVEQVGKARKAKWRLVKKP